MLKRGGFGTRGRRDIATTRLFDGLEQMKSGYVFSGLVLCIIEVGGRYEVNLHHMT